MNQQDILRTPGEPADAGAMAGPDQPGPDRSGAEQPGEGPGDLAAVRVELAAARRELETARQALAASQDRERALAYEVQHRVRNLLAVIRSVYRRTREAGASDEEFAEHFEGRLGALARHHSHLGDRSPDIDLEDIVRDELLEVHCMDGPNCTIGGPPVRLGGKSAELMGLAIHELATNSVKFGALAQEGMLTVEWSFRDEPGRPLLHFRWGETGVAPVSAAPRPSGFGRGLIEDALPYQLGATTAFELKPGGLECSILLPLPGIEAEHNR